MARCAIVTKRRTLVFLIFCGILVSYVDRGNLSLAAPVLLNEFHWSSKSMGLLLSLFFWTYGALQLPAGLLIDRFGVRSSYAIAFLLWSFASAGMALAANIQTMFGLRLLLGAAESVGPLASLALIRSLFREEERGLPVSIYISGQTIGPALGSLLGTVLIAQAGWRTMFAVTGLAALFWLPFWLLFAPKERPAPHNQLHAAEGGPPSVDWRALSKAPALWLMSGCVFLFSYFWYFLLTWMPTYLAVSRHYSMTTMGRLFSVPFFGMTVINLLAGWLADRYIATTKRNPSGVRLALGSIGLAGASALALVPQISNENTLLLVLMVSFSSFGIASTNFWALAQQIAPKSFTARTIAWFNTISQIAGATAPLLTGYILGAQRDFRASLLIAAASAGLASCLLAATGTERLAKLRAAFTQQTFSEAS